MLPVVAFYCCLWINITQRNEYGEMKPQQFSFGKDGSVGKLVSGQA